MADLTPEILKELVFRAVREALESRPSAWPRWLPIKEAARYSGLSPSTLRRLAREGEIYARNLNGGKLLFDRESIDDFMLRDRAEIEVRLDRLRRAGLCLKA